MLSPNNGACLAQWNLLRSPIDERDISLIAIRIRYRPEAENCCAECFIRLVAARCVHMAGETNTRHRVVSTCHAVGWVAPLVHVADSHGSGWSQSATVTFVLNHSCVCNLACLLTIGYLSKSQDSLDIDQRQRTAVLKCFIRLVAARCVHMAGETNTRHRVVPTW